MQPKTVKIDGDDWTLLYFDSLADVDKYEEDYNYGQCDFSNQTIRLYSGLSSLQLLKTLVHEALHVVAGTRNIDCLKKEKYHGDLDNISTAIVNLMGDNGWLRGWGHVEGRGKLKKRTHAKDKLQKKK